MDLTAIAAAAVSILVPYLGKAAGKAAEAMGTKSVEVGGKLYSFLRNKLKHANAAEALHKLSEAPEEPGRQETLRRELTEAMERDRDLKDGLIRLTDQLSA